MLINLANEWLNCQSKIACHTRESFPEYFSVHIRITTFSAVSDIAVLTLINYLQLSFSASKCPTFKVTSRGDIEDKEKQIISEMNYVMIWNSLRGDNGRDPSFTKECTLPYSEGGRENPERS